MKEAPKKIQSKSNSEKLKKIVEIVSKKKVVIITALFIILVLLFIGLFLFSKHAKAEREAKASELAALEVKAQELTDLRLLQQKKALFPDTKIGARASYVYDIRNKKTLYEKNSGLTLPIASITKVMTALTALEILGEDTYVQISWSHLLTEGDSNLFLGEQFATNDLIDFMLVESSNDGATAIAEQAGAVLRQKNPGSAYTLSNEQLFVREMNRVAKRIGLERTEFKNPTGLDESFETIPGATSTAKDVALLFAYVVNKHPTLLEATQQDLITISSKGGFSHRVENTNKVVDALPNIVASKTGFTTLAGGNLAVVIDPGINTPIIIVALGSTKEGRFTDVERLASTTLKYLSL